MRKHDDPAGRDLVYDGTVYRIHPEAVAELLALVQIGEEPEDGLSSAPIAGPPGPSCPPPS